MKTESSLRENSSLANTEYRHQQRDLEHTDIHLSNFRVFETVERAHTTHSSCTATREHTLMAAKKSAGCSHA
jgi:hypothetical protein